MPKNVLAPSMAAVMALSEICSRCDVPPCPVTSLVLTKGHLRVVLSHSLPKWGLVYNPFIQKWFAWLKHSFLWKAAHWDWKRIWRQFGREPRERGGGPWALRSKCTYLSTSIRCLESAHPRALAFFRLGIGIVLEHTEVHSQRCPDHCIGKISSSGDLK